MSPNIRGAGGISGSSPVAGTKQSLDPIREGSLSLSRNLSVVPNSETHRATWQALAKIGQGLMELANAQLGKPPVTFNPSLPPPTDGLTLTEAINEFLRAKARAGRSDRYLRALRNSLSKFHHGRARLPIGAIDLAMVEAFLSKSDWAPRTQKGYAGDLKTLFNWCVRRGYLASNPAAGVEHQSAAANAPPGIHSPEQVALVLGQARAYDLVFCRALALRYFAGIRSAEAQRLTESDILPDYVQVPAAKSKTRSRRLVPIQPNLAAWLALGGSLPLHNLGDKQRQFVHLLKQSDISWPANVCRHSFISYRLAVLGSAAKVALEAGNSEAMVFAHYRALVTAEAAAAYWSILP